MSHERLDEPRSVDRRGFLGIGAIAAGGIGAASLPSSLRGDALTNPFLGEIRTVPYNFAPRGYAFCQGQMLPINQNQSLYSLLGTNFGGDGRTTFALPDTRQVEDEMRRTTRKRFPPFRYIIALQGLYPSRS